jgi:proton-dependent oligopeptide transporter, POT family
MPNIKRLTHPKGLYFLFFTEMWERFSFFGMRALLVYYMTKQLMLGQVYASNLYGLYTGLVYFTPFIGGILSDRFFGKRTSVILGAILMCIGHFSMMYEFLFYPALILLVFGSGLLSSNIILQVNDLYKNDEKKREAGFSVFYLGINLGAILSPIICGTLGELYGWHYGFGAAGIGMFLGLIIYLKGQKYLVDAETKQEVSKPSDIEQCRAVLAEGSKTPNNIHNKIVAFVILILCGTLFRAAYSQQGNTIAIWLDSYTDRHILNWEMPAPWFQSFNSIFIVVLTPMLTKFWDWQLKRSFEQSHIIKMAIGCILTGASYLLLIPAAYIAQKTGQASLLWPTVFIFVLSIGELYFVPIALLLVARIAPVKIASMVMGIWYISYFIGNFLSGFLGGFWDKIPKSQFFLMISIVVFIAGLGLISASRFLKKTFD